MAVLMECPYCHRKQKVKNKSCINKNCSMNLEKEKKNGKVRYWITYRLNKEHIWEKAEPNEYSINDASACDGKRRGQRKDKKLKIFDIKGSPPVTFNELAEEYLKQDFVKENRSYKTICMRLGFFRKTFGSREVGNIKNSEIRNYQAKRKSEGAAASTLDQETTYAKTVLKQAVKDKKISSDVLDAFDGIQKTLKKSNGKPENAKDIILTNEQLKVLFDNIRERGKLPFVILTLTGMREGEVLRLTWDRINWEKHLIELKPEDTKEGKRKEIPIPKQVFVILEGLYGLVKEGGNTEKSIFNLTKDQFIGDFKQACKKAKIKYGRKDGVTAHTLRHTFITRALGLPGIYRRMLTGHSTVEMDERYSHPTEEDLREAQASVNKTVNIFLSLPEQPQEQKHLTP